MQLVGALDSTDLDLFGFRRTICYFGAVEINEFWTIERVAKAVMA